jgi:antitoxin (DNA-binding transcriptional repressor) of toxin-antitoxin stability system
MNNYSIRDLRERTGELVRSAQAGELSVVASHGHPVFIAVPFDDMLLAHGVKVSLAIKLFRDHVISLGKAAKMADLTKVKFIAVLGAYGVPAVEYPVSELDNELALLAS